MLNVKRGQLILRGVIIVIIFTIVMLLMTLSLRETSLRQTDNAVIIEHSEAHIGITVLTP